MDNSKLMLCKRLKKAGFPQPTWVSEDKLKRHGNVWINGIVSDAPVLIGYGIWHGPDETLIAYEPTPIELEEAVIGEMGKNLLQINISYDRNYSEWRYWAMANHSEDNKQSKDINRFTAIAELYLKIRGM